MNKKFISDVVSGIFILVFIFTSLDKFWHLKSFGNILSKSPLIGNYSSVLVWFIPVSEVIVSLLLFVPKHRMIGFYLSFLMLLAFTAYIGYMLMYVPDLPCNCGGITKYMSWGQHLAFNIVLVFLALLGILLMRRNETN
jgi:putative oxidoreductase